MLVFDDSYMDHKNLGAVYINKSAIPINASHTYNFPQSHHAVLNNFRSDFEDFSHFNDIKFITPSL